MEEGKLQKQIDHIEKTVDALARAVKKGFDVIRSEMATKTEMDAGFTAIRSEMNTGFEGVNGKIDGVHRRGESKDAFVVTIERT